MGIYICRRGIRRNSETITNHEREVRIMTTKEQERKALAQIKNIIDSLGESSYIATAFEGCIEDAEYNIENDFACSMKDRADTAEKKAAILTNENRELKATVQKIKDESSATITRLQEKIVKLQECMIPADDLCDFDQHLEEEVFTEGQKAAEAAETIVKLADNPADVAFTNAVRDHRNAQAQIKYLVDMKARVRKAINNYRTMD